MSLFHGDAFFDFLCGSVLHGKPAMVKPDHSVSEDLENLRRCDLVSYAIVRTTRWEIDLHPVHLRLEVRHIW